MRVVPEALQAKLNSGAGTLCRCWQITRADGTVMGFTDHDADLTFDGVVFQAGSGLDAGALESGSGLSVDNAQAVGALTSNGITAADIMAGRYDGADVRHYLVDWQTPEDRVLMFRGSLGEIERGETEFKAELRGLSEALNTTVGRSFMPLCDAKLGGKRCGFDVSAPGYTFEGTVEGVVSGRKFTVYGASGFAEQWFEYGTLRWISGANAGAVAVVKFDTVTGALRLIELWQEAAHVIAPADAFELIAGCDKRSETCKNKFSNFRNFRGFPNMPGEDWVTAYPANDGVHDGGRRSGG